MNIYRLIVPLGITTYLLVLITFLGGIMKVKMKYHRIMGIVALIFATTHAILVISSRF